MSDLTPENRALLAEIKLHVQEELGELRQAVLEKIGDLETAVAVLQDRQPERPRGPVLAGAGAGGLVALAAYLLDLLGLRPGGSPPPGP